MLVIGKANKQKVTEIVITDFFFILLPAWSVTSKYTDMIIGHHLFWGLGNRFWTVASINMAVNVSVCIRLPTDYSSSVHFLENGTALKQRPKFWFLTFLQHIAVIVAMAAVSIGSM